MDIAVSPLDIADTDATEPVYQLLVDATAVDLPEFPAPSRGDFFGGLRHPRPGNRHYYAIATLHGKLAGHLVIQFPELDNTDNAILEITVRPEQRRAGVGRALYEHAVEQVRAAGRKWITGFGPLGDDGRPTCAQLFATAVGAQPALVETRRRLDVTALDQANLDELVTQARDRAAGYRLVRFDGPAPDRYVADLAHLDSRLLADAPMGDLAWEPEKVDVERHRAAERAYDEWGRRRYHTIAVHEATDRAVAWTAISVAAEPPWHAFQMITLVEPAHRGHRLGVLTKIENLRYALACEPGLRVIDTFNAASNSYMISINEAIGYRRREDWENWQATV